MAPYKFGVFDFDPATGELRRDGSPVRLQSQPARVLAMLLSGAGEVVTREALRKAIWDAETFVDFDRGLNFCVAQVRSALGDSAESPRYIRTLPKRGYQFIAPVTHAEAPEPPVAVRNAKRFLYFAVAAMALALAGAWMLVRSWEPMKIAVARFDNETGEPAFDRLAGELTDLVVADLTASGNGRYRVIGSAALLRTARDQRDLGKIASTLGANYVVLGQVQGNASKLRVLAHLIRLPDQTHLRVSRFERDGNVAITQAPELAERIVGDFSQRLAASPRAPIR